MKIHLRPWMLVSAAWIGPAIFAMINEIAQRRLNGDDPASLRQLLWAGGDWLAYALITPLIFWVSDRWPVVRPHLVRRALVHVGFALLASVLWALVGKLLEAGLMLTFDPEAMDTALARSGRSLGSMFLRQWVGWIFITLPFGFWVYFGVAAVAHAIRYFIEAREREVQLAGARFSALQAQLNPHFLFNTLNTIAVRARDRDSAGVAEMVEQLGDLLRRTLSRHRATEVRLDEELALVRQYLAIEQARFSDRLRPEFRIDPAIGNAAVPGFALQHLVENAIRHGIARRPDAGRVVVAARRDGEALELTVTDDGVGAPALEHAPKGHGIDNTRERLSGLHGPRASLRVGPDAGGGTVATLRVPYREMPPEAEPAAG